MADIENRPLRFLLQAFNYSLFMGLVWFFSNSPSVSLIGEDESDTFDPAVEGFVALFDNADPASVLSDDAGRVLHEVEDNHQSHNRIRFEEAVSTDALHVEVLETHGAPASLFDVRCYAC